MCLPSGDQIGPFWFRILRALFGSGDTSIDLPSDNLMTRKLLNPSLYRVECLFNESKASLLPSGDQVALLGTHRGEYSNSISPVVTLIIISLLFPHLYRLLIE